MSKNLHTLLTKEMLEYEYKICGSMQKIADKFKVSVDSIYKYVKIHQIKYDMHYTGIYTCNENFFSYDTPESFYIAGFIAADGSLQQRQYSKILKICLSDKDLAHLEKIKLALDSDHIIKIYDVKPSKLVITTHKCAELSITSNQIYDDLQRFNIMPNKTFTYNMPEWLINHSMVHHFMRGYFDGDGTISTSSKQGGFNILGTKSFLAQYRTILENNCKLNHNKICVKGNVFSLSYGGRHMMCKLYQFLYRDATICLDRKQIKFSGFHYILGENEEKAPPKTLRDDDRSLDVHNDNQARLVDRDKMGKWELDMEKLDMEELDMEDK
jgi:hypothetical protein